MTSKSNSIDKTDPAPTPAQDSERVATPAKSTSNPPPSPPPSKGPRAWVMAIALLAIVVVFGFGSVFGPSVTSRTWKIINAFSRSGDEENLSSDADSEAAVEFYTCGMHPWVVLPEPGACPICHMDLTPLDPDKFSGEISIDPVITQNIGVRIEPVTLGPIVRTIRTVGTVTYDETRVRDVNIKVPGWIEELYVNYEGAPVQEGEPLFEFYSPQLYSSQSEYLSALKLRGPVGAEILPDTLLDAERLIADTRVQLEFYDITEAQIEALEASGEPAKTMTIRSPHKGVVIAKHANEGMRVETGMRVYQIADLSKIWVMVSLYEYQLPFIQEGQEATMSLPYIPGQTFEGRVIYIYPYLDENTRQIHVRLEFDNPNGLLKPGMYTRIELRRTLSRERTVAPRSAVIDTGERQVAFVSLGEGRFEPRNVVMGVETEGGLVEIIDGLSPGEMVVTSGQFLLDSEARIRESLAKMIKGDLASEQTAVGDVEGASELALLPDEVSEQISTALTRYFEIGDLLANDMTDGLADPARGVANAVDELLKTEIPNDLHFWHEHDEITIVRNKALDIAGTEDMPTARLAFADLSVALAKLVKATGIPPAFAVEVQELHCPMYRADQGGSTWLQVSGDVRNPFFGSVMLECFDERIVIPVTGQGADAIAPPSGSNSKKMDMDMNMDMDAGPSADVTRDAQIAIDALVSAYLVIQKSLTVDDLEGAGAQIQEIDQALAQLGASSPPGPIVRLVAQIGDGEKLDTTSLDTFRQGFRSLSDTLIEIVRIAPPSEDVAPAVYKAYCPMEKANWLQVGEEIANPYASGMLRCGSIQEEFDASTAIGGVR